MNQQSFVVSEVSEQDKLTQLDSKMSFVEPTVSAPEDVLEATNLVQAPTIDTTTV